MLTFGHLVRRNARNYPAKVAYVDGDRRVTWAELDERTNRLAQLLLSLGVERGDRVASISTDCIELVEVVVACAKVGAVRVGINHRYAASEIEHILADSGTKVLFVQSEIAGTVQDVAARLPNLQLVGFGGDHPFPVDYEKALAEQPDSNPRIPVSYEDLGYIFYSSGSTGRPKGITFTFRHVMDSLVQIALNEGCGRQDVWLHTMPAGGIPLLILVRNTYHGATCVIMRRWDPGEALELIQRERVTRTLLVPTMLVSLLHHPDLRSYKLDSLKHIEYGSAPCTPATIRLAMETFPGADLLQLYGATEATGMATMLFPEDHRRAIQEGREEILASAGKPLPYMDVDIVDEEGRPVPPGVVGEVVIEGSLLSPGYWRDPQLTAETFRNGRLHTGDMGRFDEEGYLYLVDRKKFMIVTGGYNVYPVEVENVLARHPAVKEVCVVGVPDDRWGEAVKAVVSLKPGHTADERELLAHCRADLAGYKVPKSVDFVDDLPRNAVGKLDKRAVRERYWRGRDRRIGGVQ